MKVEKKIDFCKKTREVLNKIYKISVEDLMKTQSNNARQAKIKGAEDEKAEHFCEFPPHSAVAMKEINKEFENEENFKEICLSFKEKNDCSKFNPDNSGAWNFIAKTAKYAIFIKNGASCIVNILKAGGKHEAKGTSVPENTEISTLANKALGAWSTTKLIVKEFGALLLHILSAGIWGTLRAAWNLLKLGSNILKLAVNIAKDIPYQLGNLVGLVMKILKSLVAGRRRLK